MEIKSWYPTDYRLAMSNTFSEEEVDFFLQKRGCAPRFVYGALMLPTALKYYIDMDQSMEMALNMTQATLSGYQLYTFAKSSPPVIAPSSNPRASVEGMLVFNLNDAQRNAIYQFEAGLMDLVSVEVEICQRDIRNMRSLRTVEPVGTFVWRGSVEGLMPLKGAAWQMDDFVGSSFYQNMQRSQRASWTSPSSLSSSSSRASLQDQPRPSSPQNRQGGARAASGEKMASFRKITEDYKTSPQYDAPNTRPLVVALKLLTDGQVATHRAISHPPELLHMNFTKVHNTGLPPEYKLQKSTTWKSINIIP
jgi:hypothetical protein